MNVVTNAFDANDSAMSVADAAAAALALATTGSSASFFLCMARFSPAK